MSATVLTFVISDIVNCFDNNTQGVYGDLVYTDKVDVNKVFRMNGLK